MPITNTRAAAEEAVGRITARTGAWRCVACRDDRCKVFVEFGSAVNGGARHRPELEKAFQTVMLICANCGFVHHHRIEDLEAPALPVTPISPV